MTWEIWIGMLRGSWIPTHFAKSDCYFITVSGKSVEHWAVMKFFFLQRKNSNVNRWIYNKSMRSQLSVKKWYDNFQHEDFEIQDVAHSIRSSMSTPKIVGRVHDPILAYQKLRYKRYPGNTFCTPIIICEQLGMQMMSYKCMLTWILIFIS